MTFSRGRKLNTWRTHLRLLLWIPIRPRYRQQLAQSKGRGIPHLLNRHHTWVSFLRKFEQEVSWPVCVFHHRNHLKRLWILHVYIRNPAKKSKSLQPSPEGITLSGNQTVILAFKLPESFMTWGVIPSRKCSIVSFKMVYVYIRNLSDTTRLKLMAKTVFQMYHSATLMSIAVSNWGEVLAPDNPSKEKEVMKDQYDVFLYEQNQLQEQLVNFYNYI